MNSFSRYFSRFVSFLDTWVFTRRNVRRLQSFLLFMGTLAMQVVKVCLVVVSYMGRFLLVFALLFVSAVGLSQRNR